MVTIMVEPERQQSSEIALHFRFAIRLRIRVERPGLRPAAEVEEFALTAGEEKEPVLRALVRNTSALIIQPLLKPRYGMDKGGWWKRWSCGRRGYGPTPNRRF